ncbi:DNA-binding MarR family transcriptional regulator [Thermasporomyces composti]|uniref:DNA-binding MarR family transcriptional regulator n=1 Tax=Thermasporomyces composti TaxID=696763 RepID=A0A3D9VE91_THECX|nr:DNA-binding MarR family transcriptional regulator [Thermasporomyces composti]
MTADRAQPEDSTRDATETLFVALCRMFRFFKRVPGTSIDPALQYVLHAIGGRGPLRLSDLASLVQLDVSTVSRHARALEEAGYLHRTVDPDDRRASLVSITEAGRQVLAEIADRRRALLDAALVEWPDKDRRDLARLLTRLSDDLDSTTPSS